MKGRETRFVGCSCGVRPRCGGDHERDCDAKEGPAALGTYVDDSVYPCAVVIGRGTGVKYE